MYFFMLLIKYVGIYPYYAIKSIKYDIISNILKYYNKNIIRIRKRSLKWLR